MTWMLLDEAGNAIAAYDDDVAAHVALRSLADAEPDAADHVLLVQYDDEGNVIGDAVVIGDLPPQTVSVTCLMDALAISANRRTTGFGTVRRSFDVSARPLRPRSVAS